MAKPMTITEKILADHAGLPEVTPGQLINARLDIVLGNDITAPVAINEFEKLGAEGVFDKKRICLVPDHFTPNKDIKSAEQVKKVREFARSQEIENFFELGDMGVEHCILPEKGLVGPGDVVIGADSHTCTYGALGAFATGVGSTDMAAGMITGEAWFRVPETIKFVYKGTLKPWVSGKDLILYAIGDIGVDGARYMAMEFTGPVIESLSMDSRFTMCNMAIEAGARVGLVACDEKTVAYVKDRPYAPKGADWERAVAAWQNLVSDADAQFDTVVELDAAEIKPQVSWGTSPEMVVAVDALVPDPAAQTDAVKRSGYQRALQYMGLEANQPITSIKVDRVFIGSCTNSRIEDLRAAAAVAKGRRVAASVKQAMVVPGSGLVKEQAEREGLDVIFKAAGFEWRDPGCSMCLAMNPDRLQAGEHCASTSNRNFEGRQGNGGRTHLVSPAMAAAAAVAGHFVDVREMLNEEGRA